jgi:hypothetical protein
MLLCLPVLWIYRAPVGNPTFDVGNPDKIIYPVPDTDIVKLVLMFGVILIVEPEIPVSLNTQFCPNVALLIVNCEDDRDDVVLPGALLN